MNKRLRTFLILAVLGAGIYLAIRYASKKASKPLSASAKVRTPKGLGSGINTAGVPNAIPYDGRFVQGVYGDEVRWLQQYLSDRGHPVDVDGVIGPQTAAAMAKEFNGRLVLTEAEFEEHVERNPVGGGGGGGSFWDSFTRFLPSDGAAPAPKPEPEQPSWWDNTWFSF